MLSENGVKIVVVRSDNAGKLTIPQICHCILFHRQLQECRGNLHSSSNSIEVWHDPLCLSLLRASKWKSMFFLHFYCIEIVIPRDLPIGRLEMPSGSWSQLSIAGDTVEMQKRYSNLSPLHLFSRCEFNG